MLERGRSNPPRFSNDSIQPGLSRVPIALELHRCRQRPLEFKTLGVVRQQRGGSCKERRRRGRVEPPKRLHPCSTKTTTGIMLKFRARLRRKLSRLFEVVADQVVEVRVPRLQRPRDTLVQL